MLPIKSQKDGPEFRLCSKNKYVNSLDRQDVNLQSMGRMMRTASNLREEAVSGFIIEKAWLENRFSGHACVEVILNHLIPWEVAERVPGDWWSS